MEKLLKNKGFSLMEIIISIALLTVMMSGMFAFMLNGTRIANNISTTAKRENAVVTTMQTIRSEISNAENVKIVSKSEIASLETGYSYLYCDEKGGISVYRNGTVTRYNTTDDLKDSKIFVTFKGCQSDASGNTALRTTVALYPYDKNISNAVSNDDVTYNQTRIDGLSAIGTGFSTSEEISFHNLNRRNLRIEETAGVAAEGLAGRVLKYQLPNPADYISASDGTPSVDPDDGSEATTESTTESTTEDTSDDSSDDPVLTGEKYTGYKTLFISGNTAEGQIYVDNQTYDVLNAGEWSTNITFSMPVASITCEGNKCSFEIASDNKNVTATGLCDIASGEYATFNVYITFSYDAVSMNVTEESVSSGTGVQYYQVRVDMNMPEGSPTEAGTWTASYTIPETAVGYVSNLTRTNDSINYTYDEATLTYEFSYSGTVSASFNSVFTITYTYGVKPPVTTVHYNSAGESAYVGLSEWGETVGCVVINGVDYSKDSTIEIYLTEGTSYTVYLKSSWSNTTISGFPPSTTYTYDELNGNDIWINGSYMEVSSTQPSWY